jgi:bifunctional DNase/RNase
MELIAVRIDLPGNTPVLVFRELAGAGRLLPIFIGQPEATAIAFAMDGVITPRPMTHDLLSIVIAELGATLEQVTITHVEEGTFHAELLMRVGEVEHRVSARPSDAVALALRVECPIWAAEAVVDEAGLLPDDDSESSEETGGDVVEQFREFIDNVNPDDFAS